ncbi:peptidyl-prolyl cis-trans isomerase-like 4 [Morone saxatilis]|uniref:peptidyl-prolyl cis-trans isomerase-like 4 n=1 Tax=Morone saxatilis TaxID=34816 RepID=UPI0015E23A6B|nr:peptidyl-prolyl cis-trans isomerase-like 4 [Morone saxatilis]
MVDVGFIVNFSDGHTQNPLSGCYDEFRCGSSKEGYRRQPTEATLNQRPVEFSCYRGTSLNFLKLCKIKHYNYCLIHNVQRDFIVQTGDPTGTGRGGESVYSKLYGDQARFFDAEKTPRIKHRKKGTVSMVNNGNDQHGSQVNNMYIHTVVCPL